MCRWRAFLLPWFLVLPLACSGLVEDDLSRTIDVQPGREYSMKIRLTNTDDKPVVVQLKQSDYSYVASGENYFLAPGSLPRSNASWLELASNRMEVPAKTSKDIFYMLRVPADVQGKGSYWSVILIEPENLHVVEGDGATINIKVRYAYQIVTNVGTAEAKLKLMAATLDKNLPVPRLNLDIENVGELFVQAKLGLKLYNSKGKLVKNIDGIEQKILPETSVRYAIEVADLDPEPYTGLVLLRDGDQYFGERFTIDLSSS